MAKRSAAMRSLGRGLLSTTHAGAFGLGMPPSWFPIRVVLFSGIPVMSPFSQGAGRSCCSGVRRRVSSCSRM